MGEPYFDAVKLFSDVHLRIGWQKVEKTNKPVFTDAFSVLT
jgi:hypothetical protein